MVRRLNGLGTLVICTDLAELQAMIGPPASSRPARLSTSAAVPTPAAAAPAVTAGRTSLGDLTIDPLGHLVTWRGQPLALTRPSAACSPSSPPHRSESWTYERLFESVWGCAYLGDTSILHSAVKRLRRKLRAADDTLRVHTVRGIGYRLSVG